MTGWCVLCAAIEVLADRIKTVNEAECLECEKKRKESEARAARWILTACFLDEHIRFALNTIDRHRKRNKPVVYVEELRAKLKWILDNVP